MINLVNLAGRLGADPELRYSSKGSAYCSFRIATNRWVKDNSTKGGRTETTWHKLTAFGSTAENIAKFFSKGRMIFVTGFIDHRRFEDQKTGEKRWDHRIIIERFYFITDGMDASVRNIGENTSFYGGKPAREDDAEDIEGKAPPREWPKKDKVDVDDIPF